MDSGLKVSTDGRSATFGGSDSDSEGECGAGSGKHSTSRRHHDHEEEDNPMHKTEITCFGGAFSKKILTDRISLPKDKTDEINTFIDNVINNRIKYSHESFLKFNLKSSRGLYTDFMYNKEFFKIQLKYFGGDVIVFEASVKAFDRRKYPDSDDSDYEDAKGKMENQILRPFKICSPIPSKTNPKEKTLTMDMFIDFVYESLILREPDRVYLD
ncbi:MAG: hypothetical protein Gaeavirus11_19 [Gaeavirus sp.]|uniref:Uncharacterized protein n=1 Tax=Gaeavirus sp. TaxID=2487767 RepID=A0A3G5A3V0_9VIRU|nr:MAG: hypothetical protein Gaeavirus11_19 [Gaeavirus sp.]